MSSKGRWALVLGSLLAVNALGTWGCCSVRWCDPAPASRIVIVKEKEAKAMDGYYKTVISQKKHQQIVWKLSHGSPYVNVAIKLAGNLAPFVACETHSGHPGICYIACDHGVCLSGSINPALTPPLDYDYDFAGPAMSSTDPGIRIDP